MQQLLVMRFSAMGDVALTLPVIRAVLRDNPELEIIFVTKKPFSVFFQHIERLKVVGVDFKKKYGGVLGLLKLKNDLLHDYNFDTVIDLHDVLRTKVLRTYFKLSGKKIIVFEKGREEKEQAVKTKSKEMLPHTTNRYLNAFQQSGYNSTGLFDYPNIDMDTPTMQKAESFFAHHKGHKNIGIAPFAKHATKTLPIEKMQELINGLSSTMRIFLFGGKDDMDGMKQLQLNHDNVLLTDSLSLSEQIGLMQHLDAFVTMDSSNMHLAALQGVPTISIWGGTLPHLGFAAIDASSEDMIVTHMPLSCQPCSVFGNTPCSNKELPYACFHTIQIQTILHRLNEIV